jgi:hypothetical protein
MVMMYWTRSLLVMWCCNIIYNDCDCHPLLEYGTMSFGFGSKGYNVWQTTQGLLGLRIEKGTNSIVTFPIEKDNWKNLSSIGDFDGTRIERMGELWSFTLWWT